MEDQDIDTSTVHRNPIPMKDNPINIRDLETATSLTNEGLKRTEEMFGYSYRQAIGELLYLMITCRPDIYFPLTNLSQYNTKPAEIHFQAVHDIYKYIKATENEGFIIGGNHLIWTD